MANIGYGQDYTGVQSPFTVKVDKSLTKTGWAADAAAAGLSVSEMVDKVNTFDGRIESAETNASEAKTESGEAKEAAQGAQTAVASKQDILVNQENIKSINGNSILGSGNLSVRTYQVFNNGWNVSGTTTEFCESIRDDTEATAGMAYLGVLYCSDLPGLVQGECVVEIIADNGANGKNIHLILTSAEIYPYKWELHYVKINGLYTSTGWLGYQTEITPNPTLVGFESSLSGLQVGNTKYKVVTQEYVGENYLPKTIAIKWGVGSNSIIEGDLINNNAFGNYSHAGGQNTSAGCKGWKYTATQPASTSKTIRFSHGDTPFGGEGVLALGDRISCKAGYSWNFFGVITQIIYDSIDVTASIEASEWPSNFTPWTHSSDGYIWCPDKPDAGDIMIIGEGATALGVNNKANEQGSLVAGKNNLADGRYSAVFGTDNEGGYASLVQGEANRVTGLYSMGVGTDNNVSGTRSAGLGESNTTKGNASFAFGYGCQAHKDKSLAEGWSTSTYAEAAHAEGYLSSAQGIASHAEGMSTIATSDYQHVQGKYNVNDPNSNYANIVGWGTADDARKNIFALGTDGTLHLSGDVYVNANDDSTGGHKLQPSYNHFIRIQSASVNKIYATLQLTLATPTPYTTVSSFITDILSHFPTSFDAGTGVWLSVNGSYSGNQLIGIVSSGSNSTMKIIYIDSSGDMQTQNGVSFTGITDVVLEL